MAWTDVLTALSVAAIAVMIAVFGVVAALFFRDLRRAIAEVSEIKKSLESDGKPTVESLRQLIDDASGVVSVIKTEVDGLADTSQGIRKRAENMAISVEDRLRDIEALIDVVQEEVEDTALDIAAALRTTRRGGKLFKRVKRALLRKGRRR
ncbi:MAG: hypothetical protein QNJ97_27420 [Myxococcota bacterium]|nr:hypothetical protein [Myxococcota bacterium]